MPAARGFERMMAKRRYIVSFVDHKECGVHHYALLIVQGDLLLTPSKYKEESKVV